MPAPEPARSTAQPVLGLYVHVPFCSAICNYCNFNRVLFDGPRKTQYVEAVQAEIAGRARPARADSIFFGGGTPSLLEPREVAAIIAACRASFDVAADAEVTLEANPDSVTPESLSGFLEAGVNRLSLGVQSFRDDELRRLSRLHSAGQAEAALRMARAAGFDNVSLDLMMWLPGQSVDAWLESVDALATLEPEHASLYMLEVYPNAPLRDEMARRAWSLAPDDDVAEMYLQSMGRLEAAGYGQYEISNVAQRGRESRHNLKYWQDGAWLGFGPGAHTTVDDVRSKNLSAVGDYIAAALSGGPLTAEERRLSAQDRLEEALFTALRLSAGVPVAQIRARYGVDVWSAYGSELQPFLDLGCLIYDGACLRLTREGMLVAHEVMAVFIGPVSNRTGEREQRVAGLNGGMAVLSEEA